MRGAWAFVGLLTTLVAAGCDLVRPLPEAESDVRAIEVSVFEGGYGIQWHLRMAERFNAEHAAEGMRVELWGDPRNADILKPRLLRGDPPDLILNERLPIWQLVQAEKLIPFNAALAEPPIGDSRADTWGEAFAPGMLDMYASDGNVWAIPAAYGAWLCWYNAALFRKHGWTVPETWDEFLALCDSISAAGIAPWTLQGKYANFYAWNTYVSLVHRVGGLEAINRINALEPGAFSHPHAVEAARGFQAFAADYMQAGALSMTHTESQLQFVNDQAALIFCGTWLENEMKESFPSGFELRGFAIPGVASGRGNPRLLHGQGMEFLFVPKDARHPDVAFAFARYLVSPENAPDMARSIGVISPLAGATPRDAVSPALGSVLDVLERSESIYNVRVRLLFPEWTSQVLTGAITDLLRGDLTPEEFGAVLDAGIAASVARADRPIPPYTPYDPAHFGEGS